MKAVMHHRRLACGYRTCDRDGRNPDANGPGHEDTPDPERVDCERCIADLKAHGLMPVSIAARKTQLRARLRDADVPDDVRNLAADLIDHADRLEQFVVDRLAAIEDRPAMWGSTRVEIGLQIVQLVEVWHVFRGCAFEIELAMRAVFGPGPSIDGPLTREWVAAAIAAARAMITPPARHKVPC